MALQLSPHSDLLLSLWWKNIPQINSPPEMPAFSKKLKLTIKHFQSRFKAIWFLFVCGKLHLQRSNVSNIMNPTALSGSLERCQMFAKWTQQNLFSTYWCIWFFLFFFQWWYIVNQKEVIVHHNNFCFFRFLFYFPCLLRKIFFSSTFQSLFSTIIAFSLCLLTLRVLQLDCNLWLFYYSSHVSER